MAGSSQSIKAGEAFVEASVRDKSGPGLDAIKARLRGFGLGIAKVGGGIAAAGGAILGGLGGLVGMATNTGRRLQEVSDRTGLTVERLSALKAVAEDGGTNFETLEKSLLTFQKTLGDGTAAEDLRRLGVSAGELNGLTLDQQLMRFADAIASTHDRAKQMSIAMKLLGEGGAKLLPSLRGGSAGLQDLMRQADAAGRTMSGQDAEAAAKFGRDLNALEGSVKGAAMQLGIALLPTLQQILQPTLEAARQFGAWIKANRQVATTIAAVGLALVAAGAVIGGFGLAIAAIAPILLGIKVAFGAVAAAASFLLSPVGLIVAAVAGLVIGLGYLWATSDSGKRTLAELGEGLRALMGRLRETWSGIGDAIAAGDWQLAMKIGWVRVQAEFLRGIKALRAAWEDFTGWFGERFERSLLSVTAGWLKLTGENSARVDEVKKEIQADWDLGRRQRRDGKMESFDREIEAKEAEIRKLIAQAAKARAAKEAATGRAAQTMPTQKYVSAGIAEAAKGTFSAFAIGRSLGVGDRISQRIATASEKTATNTQEIAQALRDGSGALRFA